MLIVIRNLTDRTLSLNLQQDDGSGYPLTLLPRESRNVGDVLTPYMLNLSEDISRAIAQSLISVTFTAQPNDPTPTPGGGSGGGGYTTVQNAGSALTQRTTLNATGALVASDDALNARTQLAVNVGTTGGTVAAGNDSRILGAIQSSVLAADGQLLTRAGGVPAPIARNALNVTELGVGSLADGQLLGRTGASLAPVSVGTTAGTLAAGDDSRIVGAVQGSVLTTNGDILTRTGGAPARVARSGIGVTEWGLGTATAGQIIRANAGGTALEGAVNGELVRSTPPVAASVPADAARLYATEVAGLEVFALQNADDVQLLMELRRWGLRYEYQPNPPSGAAGVPTAANGGAVLGAAFGLPAGATAAHPALTLPGTIITSAPRSVITGTAALASGAGIFMAAIGLASAVFHRGTVGTRRGGFWHEFDISTDAFATGTRRGVGFTSQLTAADPPTLQNSFLLGWGQTYSDANWHFMRRTGSGTLVDIALDGTVARPAWLGGGFFPAMPKNNTSRYRGVMLALPGRNWMGIRVWDVETGAIYLEGRYDTDLPAVETGLYAIHDANTGTLTTPGVVMNIFRISGWIGGT